MNKLFGLFLHLLSQLFLDFANDGQKFDDLEENSWDNQVNVMTGEGIWLFWKIYFILYCSNADFTELTALSRMIIIAGNA